VRKEKRKIINCFYVVIPAFFVFQNIPFVLSSAQAEYNVVTGEIEGLEGSIEKFSWGGNTNDQLQSWWSVCDMDSGWFYGSSYGWSNADISVYSGLSNPATIHDPSSLSYSSSSSGGSLANEGDSVFFKSVNGKYGAWYIDSIDFSADNLTDYAKLNGRWYYWEESKSSSLLFREFNDDPGHLSDNSDWIPGWDHTGLNLDDLVYESYPNYPAGLYLDSFGDSVHIESIDGVQYQHSVDTFFHKSTTETSPINDTLEISIDYELAQQMADQIIQLEEISHNTFQSIGGLDVIDQFSDIQDFYSTLSPDSQKGGDNSFTCVGLMEWAAEETGHNFGQGFIPDIFETIGGNLEIPFLSPWLLSVWADPLNIENYDQFFFDLADKALDLTIDVGQSIHNTIMGFFDPVDFILTDPIGRRLGYTASTGYINEIPDAFYSGNGYQEYIMILNSLSGDYNLELFGLGDEALAYVGSYNDMLFEFQGQLSLGEQISSGFNVDYKPVPEPTTMLLFGTGLAGLVGARIRKRRLLSPNARA